MKKLAANSKIIVGMSGGVDSSVSALLLKEQGYDVHGIFMQNWQQDQEDPHCTAEQDLTDARSVCDKIGIPLTTVSFADAYWDKVFQHFLDEYAAGRTPNPDILCNKEIKFKAFLEHAQQLGADYIATGHYANIEEQDGIYYLMRGNDRNKDQSYFLYTLGQHALKHALFPIGQLNKSEVRQIANKAGFPNHNKKDSTGICFIGERKFKQFLQEYLLAKPGVIKTSQGDTIGRHDGLMYYTLGQRQGLGIGGVKGYPEAPFYVIEKRITDNVLVVDQDHNHPALLTKQLKCHNVDWGYQAPTTPFRCTAKTRYRQQDAACEIVKHDGEQWYVQFDEKQWAVTPGQSVVFYHQERCLGGGIIK